MYITFILPDLKGGGAQRMVINLANWLVKCGHNIDMVIFNAEGLYKDLIAPDINIINFEKTRALQAIKPLIDYLKNNQPDIAFSALYHVNVVSLIARILAKAQSTKLIISERNNIGANLQGKATLSRLMWSAIIRYTYPKADKIVCISDGVKEALMSYMDTSDRTKFITIHNPVITDDMKANAAIHTSYIFPSDTLTKIITAGRLVDQKDYPTMLKAFAKYRDKDNTAHLVILGWGHLEDTLKSMASDMGLSKHITFKGYVDNPLPLLQQADIFLMTSAWEGFCNVIVEALYCGLNVVATDCVSGPSEILQSGKYGFLCPVGNVDRITENIERAKSAPLNADTLKMRANDFHVNTIGKEYLDLFKKVGSL